MGRTTTSLRLDDELRGRLTAAADADSTTVTALVEQFAREGLAVAAHPGVVFKPGPSGRRAALAGGPDVWEVASALRHTSGTESERVAALAHQFGVHEPHVADALTAAGHDAITPAERGAQNLPDDALVEIATTERRVIVTENASDFAHVRGVPCAVRP